MVNVIFGVVGHLLCVYLTGLAHPGRRGVDMLAMLGEAAHNPVALP